MSQSNTLKDADYKTLWLHLKNTIAKSTEEKNLNSLRETLTEEEAYLVTSSMATVLLAMEDLEKTVIKTKAEEENNTVKK